MIFLFASPLETRALSLSPATVEKELTPGQSLNLSVKLFNDTDQPQIFYPQTAGFEAGSDGATPQFLSNNDLTQAAAWFVLPVARVELAPGQTLNIPFKISAPKNVAPGGHYAALFWSDAQPDETGIGTASRVGTLFLLKIKGEVKERGLLKDFSLAGGPDVNFKLTFTNLGNVHLRPIGQVKIYDYFERLVYQTHLNSARQAVLPGSERVFSAKLTDNKFYLGPFRAVAAVSYGQGKHTATADIKFWLGLKYLKWLMVIIAVMVIVLVVKKKWKRRKL